MKAMSEAEFQAAEERLNKLAFPGVYELWPSTGKLSLGGQFALEQIEQIAAALRGPHAEPRPIP